MGLLLRLSLSPLPCAAPPPKSWHPLTRYPCPCLIKHSMGNNEDKFFTDWEETFDSFDQMGLHENLLRGIYAYGGCS